MSEKKNNDYEKPQSKGMGDELEDVSGGAGTTGVLCREGSGNTECTSGGGAASCSGGQDAGAYCVLGNSAAEGCGKGSAPLS
jgi:hypothetical protein